MYDYAYQSYLKRGIALRFNSANQCTFRLQLTVNFIAYTKLFLARKLWKEMHFQ